MSTDHNWLRSYQTLAARQPDLVGAAGPIVAGFSATTDAIHHISDATLAALMTAQVAATPTFLEGLQTLRSWLREGRDGELFIDDETGEATLESLVGPPDRVQCGGTSIQACWSWSAMGLNPLLALSNRTSRQLRATAEGVRVIVNGRAVPVQSVEPTNDQPVPSNHVLEFGLGVQGGGVTITRSSRRTVVMRRKQLQLDPGFDEQSPRLVRDGVGLVSGLNGLGSAREEAVPLVAGIAAKWRAAGARLIHLELAEYANPGELARVMELIGPQIDSVGMNASELGRLIGDGDPTRVATQFALAYGLRRVVVHADHWAMCVHKGSPGREQLALTAGSLAAANRAQTGEPQGIWTVPEGARFADDIPTSAATSGGFRSTVVATPYLANPRSTIGLGDTFVSGDLLVQANATIQ